MLSSVEQAFVERDEKRAPPKTPAWEAMADWALADNCESSRDNTIFSPQRLWLG